MYYTLVFGEISLAAVILLQSLLHSTSATLDGEEEECRRAERCRAIHDVGELGLGGKMVSLAASLVESLGYSATCPRLCCYSTDRLCSLIRRRMLLQEPTTFCWLHHHHHQRG